MKKIINIGILFLLLPLVQGLLITEVYYDAIDESNSEVIEIYNDGSEINLSEYIIRTNSGTLNEVILPEIILGENKYFLITDENYTNLRDNPSWEESDYEHNFNLKNIDGSIAILKNEVVIDAIGWGSPSIYFLGNASLETTEGNSLSRKYTTEFLNTLNNLNDFEITEPNFRNNEYEQPINQDTESEFTITILDVPPEINSIEVISETSNTGEIYPTPGEPSQVQIRVNISDANGLEGLETSITFQNNNYSLLLENGTFNGIVPINHYQTPGNYEFQVFANEINQTSSFKFLSLAAVSINGEGNITPKDSSEINISLQNYGNVETDFRTELLEITNTETEISINNFSLVYESQEYYLGEIIPVSLQPEENKELRMNLLVGQATPGEYTARIGLTAISK